MNRKVPLIAYMLFKYGSFAKPFLNIILKEKIDKAWKHYFKSQKYEWRNNFKRALEEIDKGIELCENNKTLYYLLLSEKVLFLRNLGEKKGDEYFKELRRDFAKIPILARKITAPSLLGYFVSKYKDLNTQRIRFWSSKYILDKSSELFLKVAKAEIEIKRNNIRKGISLYFDALRISKEIPHPRGVIKSLNDSAWYLRDIHPKISLKLARCSSYYVGWYKEDIESVFFVFDTLIEIQKRLKDFSILETIDIINFVEKNLPIGKGWGTKEHYKDTLSFVKKFNFDLRTKTYKNTEEIREYIKKYIGDKKLHEISKITGITRTNLRFLLLGKTKRIKDDTLRKIIEKLNISVDIFNSPLPFIIEDIKRKLLDKFYKNIDNFINLSEIERISLFIATYMSFIRDKGFYLSRKNRLRIFLEILERNPKDLIYQIKNNFELIKFFNEMMAPSNPFYSARIKLALIFLNRLNNKKRREFIYFYANLNENNRKIIDVFIRNYVRYDRKWEVNPSYINELEAFIRRFNLKKIPTYLSFYYFDREAQRENLVKILCYNYDISFKGGKINEILR